MPSTKVPTKAKTTKATPIRVNHLTNSHQVQTELPQGQRCRHTPRRYKDEDSEDEAQPDVGKTEMAWPHTTMPINTFALRAHGVQDGLGKQPFGA